MTMSMSTGNAHEFVISIQYTHITNPYIVDLLMLIKYTEILK